MWWSKLKNGAGAVKKVILSTDGGIRWGWQLMLAAAAWFVVTLLSVYGIGSLLMHLLGSWGVNAGNIHLYPMWVQYLVIYQTGIYQSAAALVMAAVGGLMIRRYGYGIGKPKTTALGLIIGIVAVMLITGIFLLADSMRIYTQIPGFSVHTFILLAICLMTALAEGLLAFGYMRQMATARGGRAAGYAACVIMFIVMDGFGSVSIIGMINLALMGAVLCAAAEKAGAWAVIGLRTGWLWASTAVMGFTGSSTAIVRLYPVSENLITGGADGLMNGLAVTIICFAVTAIIFIKEYRKCSRK